jgi:glycosyltransferase involved in cell wall biosynthesis
MSELVSIIMPVFNAEAFVAEAIESVLSQTYPHWELIIVDDGSTDASSTILSRYTDSRILILRQKNKGEGGARNTGLEVAQGTYIGFLDADDIYLPNALSDFVAYFETHPEADVVFADGYFCDEKRHLLMRFGDHRPGVFTGNILEPLILSPAIISVPTMMMVRRSAVETRRIRFNTSLKYGVDWYFWIELARFAQFYHLDRTTALYRIHTANMTSATNLRKRKNDLVPGRLKVMNADWFPQLTVATRRAFFYNLLIGLLDDEPEQQWAITEGFAFQTLPEAVQADLLRLVAGSHLIRRQNRAFAVQCLQRSLTLCPRNRKTGALLWLAERQPFLAAATLSTWRFIHSVQARLRTLGQRRPKPVPAALLPAAD